MEVNNISECEHSGRHSCLFYGSLKDLIDITLPFFAEGLRKNMLCAWVVPESLGIKGAEDALREKIKNYDECVGNCQFELFDHKNFYLKSGKFNTYEILGRWSQVENRAFERNYDGIWVSGDASWFKEVAWGKIIDYERTVDFESKKSKVTALCTYPIDKLDLVQKLVLSSCHHLVLTQKDGQLKVVRR
jgi:hypothetical protein